MRLLILVASIGALVIAKPETYKEKEDFEFSRSSSDDGTKSGYYGAQRGNMGGNYEHAHNMDTLAQHQMSSLVRQVDGELGTGANQRTGSVFTSGNSRGVYGSGMYDLSNLKGRNFEESHAFGGSHSSLSSSSGATSGLGYGREHASSNSRYSNSQSQSAIESSRYHHHSSAESASDLNIEAQQQAESLYGGLTQSEYDQQAANNYKYYSGSNGHNSNRIYVSSVPTKVYIRPGQKVTIPISSQTYDSSHFNAHLHDQNSLNSDAEYVNSGRVVNTLPVAKHYESSYKYKKEWEKHDTQTFATPTENPFTQNVEQFDNLQVSQGSRQHNNFDVNSHSSSQLNKFNSAHSNSYSTGSKTSSSHQSGYHTGLAAESQNLDSSFAGSQSKDYLHAGIGAGNMVEENINSRPKHYESSYSYHKAWERQGDPYVIVPDSSSGGSEVQSSQKFTAASENYGHSSSHHGSQYSQSQKGYSSGCNIDCVNGHIRVARSYKSDAENLEQQSQTQWANVEDIGQQTQENWDHLGDLTQQQQTKWENQEDLGQKSQNVWDNLDNLSQQSQTKWDKIVVMDQQKENKNDKQIVGQIPQNAWDKLEDLEQKPSVYPEKPADLHKETPNAQENVGNRPQYVNWHQFQNFGQQAQNSWYNENYAHHQHIKNEEQTYKYDNMHDMFNKEFENWKLMQSLSQHLGNRRRENYFNSNGQNIYSQQDGNLFGHIHDNNCHHSQDASISNTNYHNSWNAYAQDNSHNKHISDFWNNQYSNKDIFAMQQELHTVSTNQKEPKQTVSDKSKQDGSITNIWDKLDIIENTLQTQNNNQRNHNVAIKVASTEQTVTKQRETDVEKEEPYVINPVDVGRGDISTEDLTSELVLNRSEQHKDNGVSSSTISKNKETEYHNLQQNSYKTEFHIRTTTEGSIDLSVIGVENEPSEDKYSKNTYNENSKVNTEVGNASQHSSKPSNIEQQTGGISKADKELEDGIMQILMSGSEDFGQLGFEQQQNNDQQLEDFKQPNTDQQLEDFMQSNTDQQLEDFKQQNTDQQLEDINQSNTGQQLEDFKQQNTDQLLEDFMQSNTDQKLEDFGQQQSNGQQLEDFKQPKTDQQLEDFKQQNTDQQLVDLLMQSNTDQQLEDFKQQSTDQQLEDFMQSYTGQQLEDFKQQNTDQQLEGFIQSNTGQQLEDFKQQNTDQQLEGFMQSNTAQLEDFKQQNTDQQLEGFMPSNTAQKEENFWQQEQDQQLETFGHFDQLSQVNNQHQGFEEFKHNTQQPTQNNNLKQQNIWSLEERSEPHLQAFEEPKGRSFELVIPPEPVTTENPGFWKSVGNKFSGAKNTVAGWFKRS